MDNPEIRILIESKATHYGLDPDLVIAHILTESSGNPKATRFEPKFYERYVLPLNLESDEARGRATSYGLLQIMGQVAREMGFKGLFAELLEPEAGLEWGCKKLAQCYKRYRGDAGVAAYNCGTPRKLKSGAFVNQEYVNRIHKFLKQIKEREQK